MKDYNKKWRLNNKEKVKAHWTVSNAIRYGKLIRKACENCGNEKSHAHHEDYTQPLKIKWLCHNCHWVAHGWVKNKLPKKNKLHKGSKSIKSKHIELIKELRGNGFSYKEISDKINVSKSQVYKWFNNTKYF